MQADDFFPDSNKASCHHSPKTLQQSVGALPLPAPAQLGMTSTKLGNCGWSRNPTVPSMPFRNPLKAISYKQIRAAQPEGCGRKDRQAEDDIHTASTREALICTALSCGELRPRPGKKHLCECRTVCEPASRWFLALQVLFLLSLALLPVEPKTMTATVPRQKTRDAEGQEKKVVNRRQKGWKSQGECQRASGRWEG